MARFRLSDLESTNLRPLHNEGSPYFGVGNV